MKNRSNWLAASSGLTAVALLMLSLMGASVHAAQAAPNALTTGTFITITVKPGESLATYPRLYGASGAAILAANAIQDPNRIYPGQTLVIPVVATFTPSLTTAFFYTAQTNDTLAAVAQRFEQDAFTVARVNGITEFTPGVTYLMPAGPHIYILKRGDTLPMVAARYATTAQSLQDANNLPNPGVLYAGQPLFIPIRFDAAPIPIPEFVPPTPAPTAVNGATATPMPSATTAAAAPAGYIQITVQPGDSLVTYVKLYNANARAIIDANPALQANPSLIFPGQKLLIPVSTTATPTPVATGVNAAGYLQITVQPGDTLLTYIQKYGVTAEDILNLNPALRVNPALIFPGQVLLLPVTAAITTTATATPTLAGPTLTPAPTGTPAPTATPNLTPQPGAAYIQAIVQPGDTLVTFVSRYGVTASSLMASNPSLAAQPNLIFPGQALVIPVAVSFTPSRTTPFFYVIGPAETAPLIAQRFELATDTLTRANASVAFLPGATVLIPAGPHYLTVQAGDQLRYIAARYGTTVEALAVANNLPNPEQIFTGQVLYIPTRYNAAPLPFTP